eukprot:GHUV01026600.1.p1 GENE.GHUV01026600.1~~GHUV01026600.1.p1  ORF type:complete len:235 (-),score=70.08 GHUV01026600.1:212-916(-)
MAQTGRCPQVDIDFHGVLYTITISVDGEEVLRIEIEDKDTLDRWRGEFAAKCKQYSSTFICRPSCSTAPFDSHTKPLRSSTTLYADVEDITSKTGNFKKFTIFVRMLQTAILQQSDSVFVDLLTFQDLELLKSKKAGGTNGQSAPPRQLPASNKRYLILTYASEFDRVHYPLPLLPEEHPDPQRLKAVIRQLRQQLGEAQAAQQHQQQLQPQRRSRSSHNQVSTNSPAGLCMQQ